MKVAIEVFGCKVNQYDAAKWKIALSDSLVRDPKDADVVLVFSCVVTHKAENEVRQHIRRYVGEGKRVVLTGCGTHIIFKNLNMPSVDLVPPDQLDTYVESKFFVSSPRIIPFLPEHTRGFVKVEDGCNWKCSYCISSLERGKPQSRELEEILEEIRVMADRGVSEVVLTGTNLTLWSNDDKNYLDLIENVAALCQELGIRVRLSSIYPQMLNQRLVDIFASYPVAKHLHISLQSGSNRVLRAMRRSGIEHLPKMLEILRKIDYGFAFTADIIVGFPDETEQDLLLTMLILEEFNFAKLHLFPFSPRPNTPAWAMRQLNQSVVSERMRLMEQQEKHLRQKFLQSQMGLKRPSVFLKSENAALTDNFIYVPCSAFKGIQNVEVTESSYIM